MAVFVGGAMTDGKERLAGAEAKQRDLEDRYFALFNSIDQGFCTLEVAFDSNQKPIDYRFLEVSPSFERQTGIRNGAGRWMREISPDQDEHWFEIYGRVALTGEPARFENYSTPLGRWWSVYAFRVQYPEQRRVGVLFNDITEQKLAEEALRHRTAQFEQLVESAPIGIYLIDADFRILAVNPVAAPVFGKLEGTDSLEGRDLAEVIHVLWEKEYADEVVEIFKHTLDTGEPYVAKERAKERKDRGVTEYYEWRVDRITLPDGRYGAVCYFQDISTQVLARLKIAENSAKIAQQRRLYEAILQNTLDLAYIFDLDRRFIYANQVQLNVWGNTLDEAVGKNCFEIGYEASYAEMHDREIQQVISTRMPVRGELPFSGTNGRRIYEYILVPVLDAAGNVEAVAGTSRDVTDRKRAEEELALAHRRKDEFLATLAHELRNPLAPIRNSLQVLRLAGKDERATEHMHRVIERQVDHMVRLVEDLMDVSRITRGQIELRRDLVDLEAVVRSAVETSKPLIERAGHQLSVSLPDEALIVDGDLIRLAQVLANLLNNAAKYTPEGGHIWLGVRREESSAVVFVRDNGQGISPTMLPRLFDLFYQGDRTYNRAQGGLGIGLTLVHRLVEMHGGTVMAKSDGAGRGSEFVVKLPLVTQLHSADAPLPIKPRPMMAATRILIVDDNHDAADTLGLLLSVLGADVKIVHDGRAALAALRTYRPSVMLLDIGMPGMDGYDLAREARRCAEGEGVILIALSGWGQPEDRRRSGEAGIDHHLVKPVDVGALTALIESLPDNPSLH
jgi:PAS domain S-box-containing protein